MSFTRRNLCSQSSDHGIFVRGDYGSSAGLIKRNGHHGGYVNDSHVVQVIEVNGGFGKTYDGFYVCSVGLDGTKNYEKHIGDDADAYDLSREDNSIYNFEGGTCYTSENKQDTDGLLMIVNHHEGTKGAHLLNISSSGAISHAVFCDLPGADQGICVGLSNGDAWVQSVNNDQEIVLLDRSAATPYTTVLQGGNPAGLFGKIYGAKSDSSDNAIWFGLQGSNAALAKITSGGVVSWSRGFYTLNDAGDTQAVYDIATDSSDNIYCVARVYDSSATTYYTEISKWNSSGVDQWCKRLTGDLAAVSRLFLAVSPNESSVYFFSGSSSEWRIAVLDVSDGSLIKAYGYETSANTLTGESNYINFHPERIFTNSSHVFILGTWDDYLTAAAGPAWYKFSPSAFEAGVAFPDVGLAMAGSQRITGVSARTITDSSLGSTFGTYSPTPTDSSAKFASSALDVSMTFSSVEFT